MTAIKKEHRYYAAIHDVGIDTYDGFHTYAVKWTPKENVFYFDDEPIWATNFGGVSRVPSFIILSSEISNKRIIGPYAQIFGSQFIGGEFLIDYVKVYQNKNFLPYISTAESFK